MVFSRIPRNICCWPICGHGRYLFSTFPLLFWFCLRGKMKNYDHTSVVGELWFIGDLFRYQEEHCFIFLGPLFKVKASFTFLSPFLDQLTIDSPFLISSLVFIPLTSQSSLRQVHSSPISTSKSTYSALFSSSSTSSPSPSSERWKNPPVQIRWQTGTSDYKSCTKAFFFLSLPLVSSLTNQTDGPWYKTDTTSGGSEGMKLRRSDLMRKEIDLFPFLMRPIELTKDHVPHYYYYYQYYLPK